MRVLINTQVGLDARAFLTSYGFEVLYPDEPAFDKLRPDELRAALMDCDGYIAGTEPVDEALLGGNGQLKVIARVGTGTDNVNLKLCKEMGIRVINTPVAPAIAVAELTIGLMLDVARRISLSDRAVRRGEWPPAVSFAGTLIRGKTIGIAGVGQVGSRVARLLFPWYVNLLGHDQAPDTNLAACTALTYVSKDELLGRSDFLLLHLPLTDETRGWIGADELARMKPTAYLVNTARGGLVDEGALVASLQGGGIAGAALDVFEQEPYRGPLTALPNVVLTRHLGSWTAKTRQEMEMQVVEGVRAILEGRAPSKRSWRLVA
jgi:D-3-phosphoglycerate dehydrogenase